MKTPEEEITELSKAEWELIHAIKESGDLNVMDKFLKWQGQLLACNQAYLQRLQDLKDQFT